jgi:uncharacterized protein related to proFAR isomerase
MNIITSEFLEEKADSLLELFEYSKKLSARWSDRYIMLIRDHIHNIKEENEILKNNPEYRIHFLLLSRNQFIVDHQLYDLRSIQQQLETVSDPDVMYSMSRILEILRTYVALGFNDRSYLNRNVDNIKQYIQELHKLGYPY